MSRLPAGAGFDWHAAAAQQFSAVKPSVHMLKGWFRVELCVRSDAPTGIAQLYVDYGDGFRDGNTVSIPYVSGQLHKRQILFKHWVRGLRVDLVAVEGAFSLHNLTLYPVLAPYARTSMLNRLWGVDNDSADRMYRRESYWKDICAKAKDSGDSPHEFLYALYSRSFVTGGEAQHEYVRWLREVEPLSLPMSTEVMRQLAVWPERPLISVLLPVYNVAESFLRDCLDSVLAQSYPDWELCIADDASTEPHVRAVLEEYRRNDSRIHVLFREKNGHISAASNSAYSMARGEYVALLDHDDTLSEHALYFMVQAINARQGIQIIYSDEDKIDSDGRRSRPHFKSDWNPDLFYAQNYVAHLSLYRRDLIQKIGGFREGVEGSQDQDLLLRCLPHVESAQIHHIPRILYHWRAVAGSTAHSSDEKGYSTAAGLKALRDYFGSHGPEGVELEVGDLPNIYRVRWPIPTPAPRVTLLIPTRDKRELLEACVRSILDKTTYCHYEVLILDNGSIQPDTKVFLAKIQAEDSRVRVLSYDHPFNFSSINNFGVEHARGVLIGLINNDVEVISPDWLTEMVSHAMRPDIGCVGAKLYYGDDTIQHAGVVLGIGGVAGHSHKYFRRGRSGYFSRLRLVQNVSAVTGACLLVRREIYKAVGGLNERDLKVAFNDVDFCLKVREAGFRNLWTPYAELYHHESKSRGADDSPEKQARFRCEVAYMRRRWGALLSKDPYYNPNLSRAREDFSLTMVPAD